MMLAAYNVSALQYSDSKITSSYPRSKTQAQNYSPTMPFVLCLLLAIPPLLSPSVFQSHLFYLRSLNKSGRFPP